MNSKTTRILMTTAVAGILGATSSIAATPAAQAHAGKVHCLGANACKGKSACHTKHHACKGQNACKGKGFIENTRAECEALMKKDHTIKMDAEHHDHPEAKS